MNLTQALRMRSISSEARSIIAGAQIADRDPVVGAGDLNRGVEIGKFVGLGGHGAAEKEGETCNASSPGQHDIHPILTRVQYRL